MHVFLTGATGFIGSATVPDLVASGHQVTGLARSDESAGRLGEAGAEAIRGSLDDLDTLREAAAGADGVVHLAFKHEQAFAGQFPAAAEADREAIDALAAGLGEAGKPLVIATGLAGHATGAVVTEDDAADPSAAAGVRMLAEQRLLALAPGVRAASVRLAPTVHGEGDQAFVASLVQTARDTGVSAYIGDGERRWPAVHRTDAARLFRLALESAPPATVVHGAAEEGVTHRAIAEAIGRAVDLPVRSIEPSDAEQHFGWLTSFLAIDIRAKSAKTRSLLGWQPAGPTLIEDLDAGHYG